MMERLVPGTLEWELYYPEHCQRYNFFSCICGGHKVLDAACGIGYGSYIISKSGADLVCGIDKSVEAIEWANQHYKDPKIKFLVYNCESLESLDLKFDVVLSFETIEHIRYPERFVEGVYKVLNQEGIFVCSSPNILRHSQSKDSRAINPYHLSEMHFTDFEKLLTKHFIIEARYYQNESPSYKRYLNILHEIDCFHKLYRSSLLLRFEELIRKVLRRRTLMPIGLSRYLEISIPGDYLIEPMELPGDWQKTFILVGRKY